MKTITLPNSFLGEGEVKDFRFTRARYGKKSYVYKVVSDGGVWYEVIKRYATPIVVDFKKKIMSTDTIKERYPKAKDFGTKGWTYKSIKEALTKFRALENGA